MAYSIVDKNSSSTTEVLTIQEDNPYQINSMDGKYNIEAIIQTEEKPLEFKLLYCDYGSNGAVKGWLYDTNYSTEYYGGGSYPTVRTLNGRFLTEILTGFISGESDFYTISSDNQNLARIHLDVLQFQIITNNTDENDKTFYAILNISGLDSDLNETEKEFVKNNKFILYDTTRDDNAELEFNLVLNNDDIFVFEDCKYNIEDYNTYLFKCSGKENINTMLQNNGIFKEIYDLFTSKTEANFTYNFKFEPIN